MIPILLLFALNIARAAPHNAQSLAVNSDTVVTAHSARTTDTLAAHAGGRSQPIADECVHSKPGWIFCDDFESDRLKQYFEYNDARGSFTRTPAVGVLGSTGMRVHFDSGQVNAGSLRLAFGKTPAAYIHPVDSGTAIIREVYWRMYVRTDSNWTGGGGDKLSRAQSLVSPEWAQAMGAPVWSGDAGAITNYLMIDPYSGIGPTGKPVTTTYNDFPNLHWLGAVHGKTPVFDAEHVGRWYCVEARVRLNDQGQSNGEFDLWIDDSLEAAHPHLNWVGDYGEFGINTVFLENYWNAGSPVTQNRYMDNFVVSRRRIGCGSANYD